MKRRIARKKRKERKSIWKIILPISLFFLVLFSLFFLKTKYWNSKEKLAVVINKGDKVLVSLYDPLGGTQTDIIIPGNTQVQAAGELGTWKLGSLWKLGSDEKLGGSLITKTIAKNFGFPVVISWDKLSLGDRIKIKFFSLWGRTNKDEIDLTKTSFLRTATFLDGEKGYTVSKDAQEDILSLFSDEDAFGNSLKAKIVDSSGTYDLAVKVGRIVEVMGIKVAVISKSSGIDTDCRIIGKNKDLVRKLSLILGCSQSQVKDDNTFDLEINLGEKFSQGF